MKKVPYCEQNLNHWPSCFKVVHQPPCPSIVSLHKNITVHAPCISFSILVKSTYVSDWQYKDKIQIWRHHPLHNTSVQFPCRGESYATRHYFIYWASPLSLLLISSLPCLGRSQNRSAVLFWLLFATHQTSLIYSTSILRKTRLNPLLWG